MFFSLYAQLETRACNKLLLCVVLWEGGRGQVQSPSVERALPGQLRAKLSEQVSDPPIKSLKCLLEEY